jgi:2-polyprenyl-3-methyl-5-hydroxy-6-metoxy-1,4-benzoquinol methylase
MPSKLSSSSPLEHPIQSTCFICGTCDSRRYFEGEVVNGHSFRECTCCGVVQPHASSAELPYDYTAYGDYLIETEEQIVGRLRSTRKDKSKLLRNLQRSVQGNRLLDFGCGAGYFCRVASDIGYKVAGVEPSAKLRQFASERLNVTRIASGLQELSGEYDIITMFDVIEHISGESSRQVMVKLLGHLRPGGVLVGNTPNLKSLNIKILGVRDPVVWPPAHCTYFHPRSLKLFLQSLHLQDIAVRTQDFCVASFLRKEKFTRSRFELGIRRLPFSFWPVHIFLKSTSIALGTLTRLTGHGYQIHFSAAKPE